MNKGQYRHRITFQTATATTDAQGGATVAMTDLAIQWASVVPLTGERLIRMQQVINGQWYTIETNYRADLAATIEQGNPIKFGTKSLYVRSYQNVGETNDTWVFLAYDKR